MPERMRSVNFDWSISEECQTVGGHSGWPSEQQGSLMTGTGEHYSYAAWSGTTSILTDCAKGSLPWPGFRSLPASRPVCTSFESCLSVYICLGLVDRLNMAMAGLR